MAIEIKMPALSPTMEEGTLAKWLVKEGDSVASGDLLAEIETDKATMEFEAVDEGVIGQILVAEGTEKVKVGTVIATIIAEGEEAGSSPATPEKAAAEPTAKAEEQNKEEAKDAPAEAQVAPAAKAQAAAPTPSVTHGDARLKVSPLARRLAANDGIDLSAVQGSGPGGRIVKADLTGAPKGGAPASVAAAPKAAAPVAVPAPAAKAASASPTDYPTPHEQVKLSGMRKTIARRLTESKQTVPHIYLTVDVRLDALLKLRGELNDALSSRGIKVSVNDLLIKALGIALVQVPECNVQYQGDTMLKFSRADISVAVSIPGGLITPIVTEADTKSVAAISAEMKDLAERAKAGKLQPSEYQGGTASLSNMGMMGITQFDAVINPPQAMILAVSAGEKRPWVFPGDTLGVATAMYVTGSFDHRAIDGADGARLMSVFKGLVEKPLGLIA
ncbi:pyruvate dehydrogenase complex dihydrolipoamide acetyltransferase [Sphingobium sufflavum]|uniref:pyruvate dehydrogenase complex dihydrolipoamide acetyltransferase n=1 Tax=Sphingobium sufflavum TaxID=1129547 RepID=UPI001F33A97E|nr:pyruvate dehydrogenase complex dihydrolipoamide acetyltransferase [Sphingobium sufflavum]MCE7798482.1 pyruvate dehydrogenase complex dihydrolipoamide acetyltransferase [Sphingobium sufflavum]